MLILARPLLLSLFVLSKPPSVQVPFRSPNTLSNLLSSSSFTTMSSDDTAPQLSPTFLQDALTSILNSPHISFPKPPHGLPNIRLGHGPIDLFSTRFTNVFAENATGEIAGTQVDKEGLKNALLALQKVWDGDSATFEAQSVSAAGSGAKEGAEDVSVWIRCSMMVGRLICLWC